MGSENANCGCGCGGAEALLHELFDPETTAQRAREIRAEIARCPECFTQLESEQAVRGIVRDCCGKAKAPEPLRERIITSITTVSYTQVRYR